MTKNCSDLTRSEQFFLSYEFSLFLFLPVGIQINITFSTSTIIDFSSSKRCLDHGSFWIVITGKYNITIFVTDCSVTRNMTSRNVKSCSRKYLLRIIGFSMSVKPDSPFGWGQTTGRNIILSITGTAPELLLLPELEGLEELLLLELLPEVLFQWKLMPALPLLPVLFLRFFLLLCLCLTCCLKLRIHSCKICGSL